ncbi:MAG: hypothetical protein LBL66_02065 [Clostridiales bacterium]|jgi:hypothetical protein|nr:hypothetical protein [Clostridiales bacterium]
MIESKKNSRNYYGDDKKYNPAWWMMLAFAIAFVSGSIIIWVYMIPREFYVQKIFLHGDEHTAIIDGWAHQRWASKDAGYTPIVKYVDSDGIEYTKGLPRLTSGLGYATREEAERRLGEEIILKTNGSGYAVHATNTNVNPWAVVVLGIGFCLGGCYAAYFCLNPVWKQSGKIVKKGIDKTAQLISIYVFKKRRWAKKSMGRLAQKHRVGIELLLCGTSGKAVYTLKVFSRSEAENLIKETQGREVPCVVWKDKAVIKKIMDRE